MMKTCVLIASHVSYEKQISYFDKCLNSLLKQSVVPDIHVSVSSESRYRKKLRELMNKYEKNVNFHVCKQKLSQMLHLKRLNDTLIDKGYDIFMFCDDDDKYKKTRVEELSSNFEKAESQLGERFCGIRTHCTDKTFIYRNCAPEFWSYAVRPTILNMFFSKTKNYNCRKLLEHKYGDVLLRTFLSSLSGYYYWLACVTTENLYVYRVHDDSVCGKNKKLSMIGQGLISRDECNDVLISNIFNAIASSADERMRETNMKIIISHTEKNLMFHTDKDVKRMYDTDQYDHLFVKFLGVTKQELFDICDNLFDNHLKN